jgi:PAS domain S-box-containing protein
MNPSFKNQVPVILLSIGTVIIAIGMLLSFKAEKLFDRSVFWTEQTHNVIQETQNVLSLIKDVQIAGRGYIITGDSSFLEAVNLSRNLAFQHIQKLRTITADNSLQQTRIDSVERLADVMIDHVAMYTLERRKNGFYEASRILADGRGNRYFDSLKDVLDHIQKTENRLLKLRKAANQNSIEYLYQIIPFLFGGQAILTLIIFFTAKHVMKIKTASQNAQKQLASSLKSVSDYKYALDESAIVAITNQRGIIHHVNDNFRKISKYSAEELIGQDHRIINSGYHPKEFIRDLWTTIANGKIWKGELKNKAKDGTTYWVDTTIVPFLDEQGKPFQYIAIRADITNRKNFEESLQKSLKETSDYKDALDKSAIVAITDQRGIIRHVNDNFCKISKYSAEELIGQDHRIINSGYHPKEFIRALWTTIANGKIWKGEMKNKARDGTTYWVDTTIVPFLDEQGKPYQYVAIRADITSRKVAEEENVKNQLRFQRMLDKMLEGVEILDSDFRYLYVNEAYEKQVKIDTADLIGHRVTDKFPGIEHTAIFKAIQQCMDEQITIHMEDKYTFSNQLTKWFEMSFQPVQEGVFILSMDITDKKLADEKIRQSELRFRSLIENSYDIVSILDDTFSPVYRSPSATRVTGYTNEERDTVGPNVERTHPDDIERVNQAMKDVLNNPMCPIPLRYRLKHKDGHYVLIDGRITNMLHNEAIHGIVSNFRDITEHQKAEDKLKESEKIYKTIAASIPGSVICLFDRDYRYLLIEGDMLESLGYSKEKLLNNKLEDVIPTKRLQEVLPYFRRVFLGETLVFESAYSGFDTLNRYVPLRDENNNVFAAMVVVFDISDLKKAQRASVELNVSLEQKIKERTLELEIVNKELESFSYSVAHDLRTPLRAISGYGTMLEEDYDVQLDTEAKRLITQIKTNTKRMGTLIDDLLNFSKLGRKEIQTSHVDMNQLVETSINDLRLEGSEFQKITVNKLPPVTADFGLMKHVMINLIGNALKYSSKKEQPRIEVSARLENNDIVFSVADNGVGFDMAYAAKLFGVFQRLHSDEEFEGTGVGLAIVQRIIHRHHGKIWAESKMNEGATFYFSLPVIPDENQLLTSNTL